MTPKELRKEDFVRYPPEARQLATNELDLLQKLPLSFLPLLLRELIVYDWKFPVEREELQHQLRYLREMSPPQLREAMAPFAGIHLPAQLEAVDWANSPGEFSEQLSAHLWSSHQIDAFREGSVRYVRNLNASFPKQDPPVRRLAIAVIGSGVKENKYPLFRKLRPHGVYFRNINPSAGYPAILSLVGKRSADYAIPFAHWHIAGDTSERLPQKDVTSISYRSVAPIRTALVDKMRKMLQPGGGGPEAARSTLARMSPADFGLSSQETNQAILNRFMLSVLTEGSGTQLFSTIFVQWSAREALRRAQPLTLVVRFTPRQREQSMRELLAGAKTEATLDPAGSLIDADMGAYYTWLNQQRLSGAENASFLAWFEDHNEALAIGPSFARGATDDRPMPLHDLLTQLA